MSEGINLVPEQKGRGTRAFMQGALAGVLPPTAIIAITLFFQLASSDQQESLVFNRDSIVIFGACVIAFVFLGGVTSYFFSNGTRQKSFVCGVGAPWFILSAIGLGTMSNDVSKIARDAVRIEAVSTSETPILSDEESKDIQKGGGLE